MPDIFVSYASADRDAAFRIVGFLEGQGIHCWVAPRDVSPGVEYGHAIINAIEQCKALVLVLSDQSNDSQFVRKEVERAVSKTKVVLPVRIREVTPSGSLEFYISSAQWVDAWKTPMEQHLMPLVAAIKAMNSPDSAPVRSGPLHTTQVSTPTKSHSPILVGVAVIAVLLAGILGTLWNTGKSSSPPQSTGVEPTVVATPVITNPTTQTVAIENPIASQQVPSITPSPQPAASTQIQAAPVVSAPLAPATKGLKRDDPAFIIGHWCQPYNGLTIRYEIIRTGSDTVLTRINHPQSSNWDVASRVVASGGGFDFLPIDKQADQKDSYHLDIVDDKMMKLTKVGDEAQDGSIFRMRCAAE